MILYEVNIDVHPSIAAEYREWLAHHARGMFKLIDGLETAELAVREGPIPCPPDFADDDNDGGDCPSRPADWVGFTAVYRIRTRAALDDYIANRSGPMRAEAFERFGTAKIRASRRIMESFEFVQPEATA